MKIYFLVILLFICTITCAQKKTYKDSILKENDSIYVIISNKISKSKKVNFYDLPLENLKNRMGETLDGKDIYFFKNEIMALGICCAFKAEERLFYRYSSNYKNWLLYKSYYQDIEPDDIFDIIVTYFPYSLGIDGKEYPPNEKLYLEDSLQNKKISEMIFNKEYNNLESSKNLKKYQFKYSYEDLYLLLKNIPITKTTVDKYNNLAYYLAQNEKKTFEAIYLYNQILEKFPDRVVAYFNLADSYWAIGNERLAKENYQKYIELIKHQKKDLIKIPKYVWERAK